MSALTFAGLGFADWNRIEMLTIWGNDIKSQVFAETLYNGMRNIFRFSTDPTRKQSLQSRIVTCYHQHQAADANETFADGNDFHKALVWSIEQCWNRCSTHPCLSYPDLVVEIFQDESGRMQWRLSHLSMYVDYLQQLRPLNRVLSKPGSMDAYKDLQIQTISSAELIYYGCFRGRGNNKLVGLRSHPSPNWVFKGLDLVKYLMTGSAFQNWRDACYHEIRTILSLPSHPNIISKDMVFVTAAEESPEPRICGTLYPWMKDETLRDEVNKAIKLSKRLALEEKAKWCFQMASAVVHTHFRAQTYHMDIRPCKFLIDEKRDLVLIDWEQNGASLCTIAPEADGSLDAEIQIVELDDSYDGEVQIFELQAKLFYKPL